MSDEQFKILADRLDKIQSTVDRIDRDFDHVWKDNQNLTLRIGGAGNEVAEMREVIRQIPTKVKDSVDEVVEPARKEIQDLKDTIKEKKVMVIKQKSTNFFKRLWRWWCAGW